MKIAGKFFFDLFLWIFASIIAFYLRLENPLPQYGKAMMIYLLMGLPLKVALIFFFQLHRQTWRSVGVRDLYDLLKAVGLATVLLTTAPFVLLPYVGIPRSVPLIGGATALLLLSGVRVLARSMHELKLKGRVPGKRVLVVGAGEAGTMIVRELLRHPEVGLYPVAFLDDDPRKRRQSVAGVKVRGTLEDLPRVVKSLGVEEVLVAMPSATGQVVRRIINLARSSNVRFRILPGIYEILSGRVNISQIREVRLEDLLRREPVQLNIQEIASCVEKKIVMVTGAGGSIGSELVRQIHRFSPELILLVGRGENSLFLVEKELETLNPNGKNYRVVVADVRDYPRMEYIFKTYHPHVVFHAAAHKHVPMMEMNPDEAIFNNVGGTKNIVQLCLEYEAERLVNISTDKAVNPTSIMGASKRVAEKVVAWGAQMANPQQNFVSVRFGNVLGSRGSVVPLFMEQIRRGGPVTITHPEMRRYFMTIPEAVQLVLQAGAMGGRGLVYVLDMGEPVRIVDLAVDLIRLAGLEPFKDIEIVFTGTRPGEKLFEELLTAEEGTTVSRHKKIFIARGNNPDSDFEFHLNQLLQAAQTRDIFLIQRALKTLVPSYTPSEVQEDLVP